MSLFLTGCEGKLTELQKKPANKLIDKLIYKINKGDYKRALELFTPDVRERIHNVGGPGTPLEGFFWGLKPALVKRTNWRGSKTKIWVDFTGGTEKLKMSITRFPDKGWYISFLKGEGWRV